MSGPLRGLCTWCIGEIITPGSGLCIFIPPGASTEDVQRLHTAQQYGDPDVVAEVISSGQRVELNGYPMTPPVTTWHGDPVCRVHLPKLIEQSRVQTVRMAQWGH